MGASSLHSCPSSVIPCMKPGRPLPSHSLHIPICAMGISTLCSHRSSVIPNSHCPGLCRGGAESHRGVAGSQPLWEPAEGAGVKGRGLGIQPDLPSNRSSAIYLMWGHSFLVCNIRLVLATLQDYSEACLVIMWQVELAFSA